jgi:arsenate reductase (thioredoxin)
MQQRQALLMSTPARQRLLFLCTGNACRSQMAEGWGRALLGEYFEVHSAGVKPHGVDPRAVHVMAEVDVDIRSHHSKHVDELVDIDFDVVVTVCDNAAGECPVYPGSVTRIHHAFDDPPRLAREAAPDEDAQLLPYRRVRDEIRDFVATLPRQLGLLNHRIDSTAEAP